MATTLLSTTAIPATSEPGVPRPVVSAATSDVPTPPQSLGAHEAMAADHRLRRRRVLRTRHHRQSRQPHSRTAHRNRDGEAGDDTREGINGYPSKDVRFRNNSGHRRRVACRHIGRCCIWWRSRHRDDNRDCERASHYHAGSANERTNRTARGNSCCNRHREIGGNPDRKANSNGEADRDTGHATG